MPEANAIPADVSALVANWLDAGRPVQPAIPWPRERWIAALPHHADRFEALPDLLDRDVIRQAVGQALTAGDALAAFLAPMVWGFGRVGYGPHRVSKMLASRPDIEACLTEAAHHAAEGRALDAYRTLAGTHRVAGLGPAFGTKFLYFASPAHGRALILDDLVAKALHRTASLRLDPRYWRERTYATYLGTMTVWARQLDVAPDEIEQVLFIDQATLGGGQWGAG